MNTHSNMGWIRWTAQLTYRSKKKNRSLGWCCNVDARHSQNLYCECRVFCTTEFIACKGAINSHVVPLNDTRYLSIRIFLFVREIKYKTWIQRVERLYGSEWVMRSTDIALSIRKCDMFLMRKNDMKCHWRIVQLNYRPSSDEAYAWDHFGEFR